MKRVIPVLVISALMVVGCSTKKTAATQPIPSEIQPMPASTYPESTPPTMVPATPSTATPRTATPTAKAAKPAPSKSTAKSSATAKPTAAAAKASGKTYQVKKGDTLSVIAKAHHTTIKKIKAVNPGLNPDRIYVGQKLKMP